MGITHHPSAQLVADYLIANISPGVAPVVAAHIERCPKCGLRATVAAGDAGQPEFMSVNMSELGAEVAPRSRPGALGGIQLQPWTTLGQGVEGALALNTSGLGEVVYVLRVAPKGEISATTLKSAFALLVMEGALTIDGRRLRAGDMVEVTASPTSVSADSSKGVSLLVVADERPRGLGRGLGRVAKP